MTQTVECKKLKQTLPALTSAPYPGELGQQILNEISAQAWQDWLSHQTMLLNENRLSMVAPKDRAFLKEEMIKFLFGQGSETPEGYIPPSD